MTIALVGPVPELRELLVRVPVDNAIVLDIQEGVPILRATDGIRARIESLLIKQQEDSLSPTESQELDWYEEVDDYLSFLNRVTRNLMLSQAR